MGAIRYKFPSVPAQDAPGREQLYAGIYADLERLGLAVPATPAQDISREALIEHLQAQAGARLKEYMTADRDGAFAGAVTPAAKTERANRSFNRNVPVRDDERGGARNTVVAMPPPLYEALAGFPHGPNTVDEEDVAGATDSEVVPPL